jgi:hypothetical protein
LPVSNSGADAEFDIDDDADTQAAEEEDDHEADIETSSMDTFFKPRASATYIVLTETTLRMLLGSAPLSHAHAFFADAESTATLLTNCKGLYLQMLFSGARKYTTTGTCYRKEDLPYRAIGRSILTDGFDLQLSTMLHRQVCLFYLIIHNRMFTLQTNYIHLHIHSEN